jgi:hypothetical protein
LAEGTGTGTANWSPAEYYERLSDDIVKLLIKFVIDIDAGPVNNPNIIILNSSSKSKFSRHIIVKYDDWMFANNYICGALIRNFVLHLKRVLPESFIGDKSIIDVGIYTRNRDFRLVGSCKKTNSSPRWLTLHNMKSLTFDDFKSTLVTCPHPTKYLVCRIIDVINDGIPLSSSANINIITSDTRSLSRRNGVEIETKSKKDKPRPATNAKSERFAKWIIRSPSFKEYGQTTILFFINMFKLI